MNNSIIKQYRYMETKTITIAEWGLTLELSLRDYAELTELKAKLDAGERPAGRKAKATLSPVG